ncbi:GntR family transcriptional regulator [Nocardioides baekrokdamisoli]|uniref:GntR family transcriptional regulator n=1 Tax=Nocardioides baekrokdamisoli TaxID=1804624 RepID=A0A3G9IX97_9ACTN|nr:GntR family transcriptional regulator [Nocardioides baekrokdamisoli]BBH17003.1 GntR family transcriptional regulator [Nocardioides baekrokdamisoli]
MTHPSFLLERTPKYVQVREYVRDLVGNALPGSPAPSERELVNVFAVARMTVRQAIDALVAEGLLERKPGRGTFVAARPGSQSHAVVGLTEYMAIRGVEVTSRTVVIRTQQAGPGVARALSIPEGVEVVHWRRVRHADGLPFGIEDVYLPLELVPDLAQAEPASLYDYLAAIGMRPTSNDDTYTADAASIEDSEFLGVEIGSPVLRKQRRALVDRIPIEVSRGAWRTDVHALWLRFSD